LGQLGAATWRPTNLNNWIFFELAVHIVNPDFRPHRTIGREEFGSETFYVSGPFLFLGREGPVVDGSVALLESPPMQPGVSQIEILAGNWPEYGPIYPFVANPPVVNCFGINLRLVCFFHGTEEVVGSIPTRFTIKSTA
jgi:hypothetical protein